MSELTTMEKAQLALAALRPAPQAFLGTRVFRCDPQALRELLVLACCPIVCKGYSTPPENWHQLCEAKADKAMAALDVRDF